jgi:ubiquinone/menaquinone biosynthesis C-methylase UbiE
MLAEASRKHACHSNVELVGGVFRRLPLRDASVDMVVSNMALPSAERAGGGARAIAELKRILRPDGELRITTYATSVASALGRAGLEHRVIPRGLVLTRPRQGRVARALYESAVREHGDVVDVHQWIWRAAPGSSEVSA